MALYGSTSAATSTVLQICPFDFQSPLSTTSNNIKNFDFLDYFSYLYGWYAGGVNVSLYNLSTAVNRYYEVRMLPGLNYYYPTNFSRVSFLSTDDATLYDNTLAQLPLPTQVIKSDLEGMVNLMVPYYNRVQITPVLTKEQTQNLTEQGSYPTPIVYVKTPSNSSNYRVFRSATDSFQFYYLLGPPQVVLLSGVAQLDPFIYPNVLITKQKQTVTSAIGGTYTVAPFFQEQTQDFVGQTSVTLTPDTFFLSLYRDQALDPNNLMIVPGGDSYEFTRGTGGDILLSKTGINLNAWYLLTGTLPTAEIVSGVSVTRDVYHVLTPATVLPTSKPILRSYVNKSSLIYNATNSTLAIQQWNSGTPTARITYYPIQSPMLLFSRKFNALVILDTGTELGWELLLGVGLVMEDRDRNRYQFVTGLGDQVKYDGTSPVSPYVINTPT